MATLAPYKLLYAMQLADLGMLEQAHHYLQLLQPLVSDKKAAAAYPGGFVQQVNLFAHRMSHISAGLSMALSKGGRWNPLSTLGSLVGRGLYAIIGDGEAEDDGSAHATMGIPPPTAVPAPAAEPIYVKPVVRPAAQKEAPPPKPKPAPAPAPTPAPKAAPPPAKKDEKKEREEEGKRKAAASKKGGDEEGERSGWLGGWFGRKVKNPVHLGKKMDDIVYDNELKMYVKKGTREPAFGSAATRVAAPPSDAMLGLGAGSASAPPMSAPPMSAGPPVGAPPAMSAYSAPPPQPAGAAPGPASAPVSSPTAMPGAPGADGGAGSRFSRFGGNKARSRYFDPLNPGADGAAAAPAPPMLAPALLAPKPAALLTPAAPAVFTPTVAEAPSTYESPDFYAPPPPPAYEEAPAPEASAPPPALATQEPPAVDNSWLDT